MLATLVSILSLAALFLPPSLSSHHELTRKYIANNNNKEVECEMKRIAFEMAMKVAPVARKSATQIFEELELERCQSAAGSELLLKRYASSDPAATKAAAAAAVAASRKRRLLEDERTNTDNANTPTPASKIYVDCLSGNDRLNHGRSRDAPLQTPQAAQRLARRILSLQRSVNVTMRGICHLAQPLVLTPKDSHTHWIADKDDDGVVFSGGARLDNLEWTVYNKNVFVATLPPRVNVSAVDSLFAVFQEEQQIRLVRARYPNGNSEKDQMPEGYTKFGGAVSSVDAWRVARNVSLRYPAAARNASIYPFFGYSRDDRWAMDYHAELDPSKSYYAHERQFWHPTIATAAKYDAATFSPRVTDWTNVRDAVLHVIHYDWWGNWQWQLRDVVHENCTFVFGRGGWQDAHGGPVSHNYFFVENILQELDAPGEWYADVKTRKLYYWPIPEHDAMDPTDWVFVASQLATLVQFGDNDDAVTDASDMDTDFVHDVTFQRITFAHSTATYLTQRYTVPSAGDWSVLPQGSITLQGPAHSISIQECNFLQVSGNAIALSGHVHKIRIEDCDFRNIGDSAIVSVGELPYEEPYLYDEAASSSKIPTNITIARNHFGRFGVLGKQTSALFVALSRQISFINNVVYNGPRAGININDGFGGGMRIEGNVIFNQVLESGDHGPINTWSRSAYLYKKNATHTTATPEWNHISGNMIMLGPKMGSLYGPGNGPCSNGDPTFYCPKDGQTLFSCLDHDDGSDYYHDSRNVCAFVGMKNYLGQNKIWDNNLIVYPEGASSQNRSGLPCLWTSMDLPNDNNQEPAYCNARPCRTREVFVNNQCITAYQAPIEYDMLNLTDLKMQGPRDTTIPFTANNTYYLHNGIYTFGPYQWNLTLTKLHGIDVGSKVYPSIGANQLGKIARQMLKL